MAYEKAIAEVCRELDNAIKTRKRHRDSVLAKVFAEPRPEIDTEIYLYFIECLGGLQMNKNLLP